MPTSDSVRRAVAADADAVAQVTRAAYAQWVPVIGREPTPMMADHAAAIADDHVAVIIARGAIVAVAHLLVRPHDILVENLAVEPASQGRGLGAMLLAYAETTAVAASRDTVRLYTNARFAANIAYYLTRGFTVEAEADTPSGPTVYFVKALSVASAAGAGELAAR